MYCLLMQAFMADHGQWNRGKSCSQGMMNYVNYLSMHVNQIPIILQLDDLSYYTEFVQHCISQAAEMGTEYVSLCTQR